MRSERAGNILYLGKAFDAMVTNDAQSDVCAMDISNTEVRSKVTYMPARPMSKFRFLMA